MGGSIRTQVGSRGTRQWPTAPAAALVEQHDVVERRIEQTPLPRRTPRARPPMQEQRREARGIATALPVHLVPVAHVQPATGRRLHRWEHPAIPRADAACLACGIMPRLTPAAAAAE